MHFIGLFFITTHEIIRLDVPVYEVEDMKISYPLNHLVEEHARCLETEPSSTYFEQIV